MSAPPPLERFARHLAERLQDGTLVRLLLSQPDPAVSAGIERVIGRLVDIRGQAMLSLTLREPKRDTTRNLALDEVHDWLMAEVPARFRSAVLESATKTWQLSPSPRGELRLAIHRGRAGPPPSRTHDQSKSGFLDDSARPWLIQLGICAEDGCVRASMADKHRQIARYLEIVSHRVRECGWGSGHAVRVVDMGAGKGYLTFGLWHLLTRTLGLRAEVIGLELRTDLVEQANAVVRAVGAEGLRFLAGSIADADLAPCDMLVALHACNTATDDAIRRGIAWGSKLIVVSPCCHQEIRPQLGRPEPLAPLLDHGILAERLAEWATDGLRALHLEHAGYATRVMEFIASEHTPRNLLLTGCRRDGFDPEAQARAGAQIEALKRFLGIRHHALDPLLAQLPRPVR